MLARVNDFFIAGALGVLATLFTGCDSFSSNESHSIPTLKQPIYSYDYFPNITDTNITLRDIENKNIIFETQVKNDGSFIVDINSSVDKKSLVKVSLQNTPLVTYATIEELINSGIGISALTTLSSISIKEDDNSSQIIEKLSSFAQTFMHSSINEDTILDYKALNSFIPDVTPKKQFVNPLFYTQMQENGFFNAIIYDENLTKFIHTDEDSDGLDWYEELLVGTSPQKNDSDGDGIADGEEVSLRLSPISSDTDFDGLSDYEELLGVTDPRLSDSDGDYFSDYYETLHGSDPLNPDENANGVLDGLDGDPLFKYQWHIKSNGDIVSNTNNRATIVGNDLNILDVYKYRRGDKQSIVQVVDTGVELLHEDLNVDVEYSWNSVNGTNDPTPTRQVTSYNKASPFEIGHGTAVAGIVGAIANNGVGVRGIVPGATIAGSNWLEEQSIGELDGLWYNSPNANEILVSNNSWGTYMSKDKSFEEIMKLASEQLRDGKGRIFTFASGNDREIYGNANLSYIANNRYAITVASLTHENKYSYYSNPGSNVMVSAYGGSSYEIAPTIATTLLSGKSYYASELGSTLGAITFDDDLSRSYTYTMNGTSAATPMVSGGIALVLNSCPDLTWRDVKWLLSYTSKKIDSNESSWISNGAGRHHNINYGFGLIDTDAMIQECRSNYYELLPKEEYFSKTLENLNIYIPDNNTTKKIVINFEENLEIEWVELTVDSNHPYAGDYEISLISPYGTKTQIISPNELRSAYYKGGFRFSSAAFMGELSRGSWSVEVVDRLATDSGSITGLKLGVYGHEK